MDSKIAALVKLNTSPVAVVQADACPEKVLRFKPGQRGCVIASLVAAAHGKVAAFTAETTPCLGGRAGLGFAKYPLGWIEYFLSTGSPTVERCERYKKTPDAARNFICNVSNALIESLPARKKFLLFKPLETVDDKTPDVVIFLVNADQLSGLVTLANFDSSRNDGVKLLFGAGCAQVVLYPLVEKKICFVGLTDPSARKFVDKNLLAVSMSYERFVELEAVAHESFLSADAWRKISARL